MGLSTKYGFSCLGFI